MIKSETERQRDIEIGEDSFQNLNKVIENVLRNKEKMIRNLKQQRSHFTN